MMLNFLLLTCEGPKTSPAPDVVIREIAYVRQIPGRAKTHHVITLKGGQSYRLALKSLECKPGIHDAKALNPRLGGITRGQLEAGQGPAFRQRLADAWEEYNALPEGQKNPITERELKKKRKSLGYLESLEEWVGVRAWPTLRMDTSTYGPARRQKSALEVLNPHQPSPWTFIGPTNLNNGGVQSGFGPSPVNGRINAAAFEPANALTFYLAAGCGGVWKTVDGGTNFAPLTDGQGEIYTSAVATNPQIANRVYAGTGDYPGSRGNGLGLLVSTNGGVSWNMRGAAQFAENLISDISVDPELSSVLVVASGRGPDGVNNLYRTDDEGLSWDNVINEDANWSDLDISNLELFTRYLYAAGLRAGTEQVLWRSDDRGVTWNKLTPPTGAANEEIYVACSKIASRTVYLLYPVSRKVYRNTNRGIGSWTDITGNLPTISGSNWGQGTYNAGLTCFSRVSGSNLADALIVCNIDLYLSPTANGTWKSIGDGYTGNDKLHVDHHMVVAHPTQALTFLCLNDGGAYGMNFNAGTDTGSFVPLNQKLGTALVSRISIDANVQDYVLAGMQDNGLGQSADIQNWNNLAAGDLGHTAIRPDIGGYQYIVPPSFSKNAMGNGHFTRTTDGWATQSNVPISVGTDKQRSSAPILINPADPNLVYFGTNYLYRWNEATQVMTNRVGNQKLSTNEHIRCIGMGASNSQRIYTGSKDGELWMTSNGGTTWTRIDSGNPSLPVGSIGAISVNPSNSRSVLVGFENSVPGAKLWECTDTTANPRVWIARSGIVPKQMPDIPINAIARNPSTPSTHFYVGNDVGVFGTWDGGISWFDLGPNASLPNVEITDLKVQTPTKLIYAATYGRGVWRRSLPVPVDDLVFGKIGLAGLKPTPEGRIGEVEVFENGTLRETIPLRFREDGAFGFAPPVKGLLKLRFKLLKGLKKSVEVNFTGAPLSIPGFVMTNGDCDGDNYIGTDDYLILNQSFDRTFEETGYDDRADLDGDGYVGTDDYLLFNAGFDMQGD